MVKMVAVGDIMPGGVLAGHNDGYVSQEVLDVLSKGDIRVGTLETAIGNSPTFSEEKMSRKKDVIYALDNDLGKLKHLGLDIVSLANNHFFDLGPEGARHTIELLDEMGIQHVGAGRNIEEASRPVIKSVGGRKVAFIAFCECREDLIGWCPVAKDNEPGVNPLEEEYVASEIKRCKGMSDHVVVIPHWGKEGQVMPTDREYRLAKKMIASGADLVLGGHTHCIQPIYRTRGKSVVFSMGNFLFPDRLLAPPRSTYYPPSPIDIASLPVTDRFPAVDTVTLKIWRSMARYGLMVEALLDADGASALPHVVHLTDENFVELSKEEFYYQSDVKRAQIALKSGCYPLVYLPQKIGNGLKPYVKGLLKKIK